MPDIDTIAAIATPPGTGGVGIVRVSGQQSKVIAQTILGRCPKVRHAELVSVRDSSDNIIDQGISLFFENPSSFTGEDVLEIHGHGGVVVMQMILQRIVELGARLARPGEFSERAFLNNKLDLAQAEAIADLISSKTQSSVKAANRSLKGEFSKHVNAILSRLTQLRVFVESSIDFPEEEIDFLADKRIIEWNHQLIGDTELLLQRANQGKLLTDGIVMVIAGKPNVGKSSLLNAMTGIDSAIVSGIPGTTRDMIKESIQIGGIPIHLVDTAGLRQSNEEIEVEGIKRSYGAIKNADLVLYVVDVNDDDSAQIDTAKKLANAALLIIVHNKIDSIHRKVSLSQLTSHSEIFISVKKNQGIDDLKSHIKVILGFDERSDGDFSARTRHINALTRVHEHLLQAKIQLLDHAAGELMAEELRRAQLCLAEITGEFTSDNLLGEIFSSFCIGK